MDKEYEKVTEVVTGEYKGFPVITIPLGNGSGFMFGYKKAKAIIQNYKAICDWVEANTN